ncbi:hypothetical protein EPI10_022805 [Gossypium australe]|uniref:Uncharacterized protein n=1 Tax=Gossypium australe TaxID=47621 RepID=A0A5B6VSV1_9ROSI|nr:hypothetical protein EPI10_022805 [Gossypium australe]
MPANKIYGYDDIREGQEPVGALVAISALRVPFRYRFWRACACNSIKTEPGVYMKYRKMSFSKS